MFKKLGRKALGHIVSIVQCGCLTHCVLEYIGNIVQCTGPSMEPTIFSNDFLLTEHISPRLESFSKGDVIIAKCPSKPGQHICKRITALPGDRVYCGFTSYVVPPGHLWLEGDNRSNSQDSRTYGPVPQGLVRGRAWIKVWPLADISLLRAKHIEHD